MRTFLMGGAVLAISATGVLADPPPEPRIPDVFCFRITDIERLSGLDGSDGNDFAFEFEVLNWSDTPAAGVAIAATVATSGSGSSRAPLIGAAPTVAGIGIDRDGRGGPLGGTDIDASGLGLTTGSGTFDTPAIQSGRGRGDVAGLLNDWDPTSFNATSARWDAGSGTAVPNRDLLGTFNTAGLAAAQALIPGVPPVVDSLGDSAVDGGPSPYGPGFGGGEPTPDGSGNVLDGFTLTITDWDTNEIFSFNWNLLNANGGLIGTTGFGNDYGFGVVNLVRLDPNGTLPGAQFVQNAGFLNQGANLFFDSVWQVPNPTDFAGEFGAGIIAPFMDQNDNTFDQQPNTQLVPIPAAGLLYGGGLMVIMSVAARLRRRRAADA